MEGFKMTEAERQKAIRAAINPDGFQTFGSSTMVDQGTSLRIYVNHAEVEEFKAMVFRGMNNSPDASVAMKQFYDILAHGKPLQDYQSQQYSPTK